MTRGDTTTSRTRGMRGAVGDKSAAVAATQQSTKQKQGKDRLIVSAGGGPATAHLAAGGISSAMVGVTVMTQQHRDKNDNGSSSGEHQEQHGNEHSSTIPASVNNARQTQSMPMRMSTSASHDNYIKTSRQQLRGRCCGTGGQTARQEWVAEGMTIVVGARRGSCRQWQRWTDYVRRADDEQRTARQERLG